MQIFSLIANISQDYGRLSKLESNVVSLLSKKKIRLEIKASSCRSNVEPILFTFLIHSADPHARPVGIIVFAHIVRLSVPTFQNLAKQNKAKLMFATGETVGLAKWIIDDISLVHFFSKPRGMGVDILQL